MLRGLRNWLRQRFRRKPSATTMQWYQPWSDFLAREVAFYRTLDATDRHVFHQRIWLFLETTAVDASPAQVSDEDRLLVAASAIIPVWGFPGWHYFNLKGVFLLPGAFNEKFECGQPDSRITGMVGTGPMAGKMVLSRPDLHQGFANSRDKRNVGIHEFVHLIDMADGECDGYPERLHEYSFAIPWFELVGRKIDAIERRQSNIDAYGATNRAEFFAVASEYFFERPAMMRKRHPQLFAALTNFYRQDVMAIAADIKVRRKAPCPCGSGKRYKRCCLPQD